MKIKNKYYRLSLFLFAFSLICGCNTLQDDNVALVNKYFNALNNKNKSVCNSIVTVDFRKTNNEKMEDAVGAIVLLNAIDNHSKNNSEYEYTIEDIFASENRVGVRWRWKSINIKTGEPKPINISGISIFEITGSKISRLWQTFNLQEFNRQLLNKTE